MDKSIYREYRCECGKLLFKGILVDSEIEVKCKGCKEVQKITGVKSDELICHKVGCPNRI